MKLTDLTDLLLGRATVDGALASFRKVIDRLQRIEERCDRFVASNTREIERLVAENEGLSRESARAKNTAAKLANMIRIDDMGAR